MMWHTAECHSLWRYSSIVSIYVSQTLYAVLGNISYIYLIRKITAFLISLKIGI